MYINHDIKYSKSKVLIDYAASEKYKKKKFKNFISQNSIEKKDKDKKIIRK